MRILSLVLITLFLALVSFDTKAQHHEITKLDNQIELMLDSAAKHMINFILTKKEAEYKTAVDKASKAEDLNKTMLTKAASLNAKIEKDVEDDRDDEIKSYKDQSIKDIVLNDKGLGKSQIKYHGQTYTVSEKSKKLFDTFSSYLPRN
jgi:hypothetical protein